jgi:predicted ribosomally synthesized peptide with SipW-like signal peptide
MHETDTTEADTRKTRRRRGIIVLLLALSIGTLGAGAFSLALFTDSDASGGSFTAGTIDIATNPSTLFTVANMMPGDSGSASLTVQNNGSSQLRYAMTSSSTNTDTKGLRDQISLSVKAGACPGAGAALYNAALNGAAFGDVTVGNQAGDRTLNAAASEQLCFAWNLPLLGTGDAFQGATTTTTFSFTAEQTANNP